MDGRGFFRMLWHAGSGLEALRYRGRYLNLADTGAWSPYRYVPEALLPGLLLDRYPRICPSD